MINLTFKAVAMRSFEVPTPAFFTVIVKIDGLSPKWTYYYHGEQGLLQFNTLEKANEKAQALSAQQIKDAS